MLIATIYVDDQVYGGIEYGSHDAHDVLILGEESRLLESRRNLTSHLERIIDWIDYGRLSAKTIRIELGEE